MKTSAAHMRRLVQSPRAPELRQLARALRQTRPARQAHAACRAALDAYTDAELAGNLAAWTRSPTHRHLLVCAPCAAQYANLLQKKLTARHLEN